MTTLADVTPGQTVRLREPEASLAAAFREQLAAYGLLPGHEVTVLAQQPMTIVLRDHVELALEAPVARALRVSVDRLGPARV